MALVSCPECGGQVSSAAKMCPHCGYPLNELPPESGTISVLWIQPSGNPTYKLTVKVDGQKIDTLKAGDSLDLNGVPFGEHTVEVFQAFRKELTKRVTVSPDRPSVTIAFQESLFGASELDPATIPRCPTCGSTSIKKLTGTGRAAGVALFGLASGNIGKTFRCLKCGYKW